jgi:hypothetical protein
MPISYTVEKERGYVNAVATGIIITEEVLEYEKSIEEDPNIDKINAELFDVSEIKSSKIDFNGLERIALLVKKSKKRYLGSKLAIVVSKGTSFDNARYYEHIAYDIHNVIVFNSKETAKVWLGVT